jgi:hypothetical protein
MNLDPTGNNVGLDEQNQLFGAEVFPNLTADNFSVRYTMGVASEVTINVTDISGKVIAEFSEGTHQLSELRFIHSRCLLHNNCFRKLYPY